MYFIYLNNLSIYCKDHFTAFCKNIRKMKCASVVYL